MSNALYPDQVHGLTFTILKTPEFSTLIEAVPSAVELRLPQTRNPIWHFTLVYDYLYGNTRSPNNTRPYGPYSDLAHLQGFYLARQGKFDDFLLNDPKDNTAAGVLLGAWQAVASYGFNAVVIDPAGHAQMSLLGGISGANAPVWNDSGGTTVDGTITWADQGSFPFGFPNAPCVLQVLADGVGNYYSPVQRVLGGVVYEDITDLNGDITVYADGMLQTAGTNYTLLGPGLWLDDVLYSGMYLKWAAQPVQPVSASFAFYFRARFEMDSQDFERTMDELYTIGGSMSKQGSGSLKLITARPNAPSAPAPIVPPPPPAPTIAGITLTIISAFTTEEVFNIVGAVGTSAGVVPASITQFGDAAVQQQYQSSVGWAKRTDTFPVPGAPNAYPPPGDNLFSITAPVPSTIAEIEAFQLSFRTGNPPLLNTEAAGNTYFSIYAVWFTVNYSDGSSTQYWPSVQQFYINDGAGNMSQNALAIDRDPDTFALLNSTAWGNFGIPCRFQLSVFTQ